MKNLVGKQITINFHGKFHKNDVIKEDRGWAYLLREGFMSLDDGIPNKFILKSEVVAERGKLTYNAY